MIEVEYVLTDGKKRIGILIQDNIKTAWIKPFRWIKNKPVKIHKIKNKFRILT